MPHFTIGETLLERNAQAFKARTCLFDVLHGNCDVAEPSAGVSVAAGVTLEVRVGFSAMVVSKLKDA